MTVTHESLHNLASCLWLSQCIVAIKNANMILNCILDSRTVTETKGREREREREREEKRRGKLCFAMTHS